MLKNYGDVNQKIDALAEELARIPDGEIVEWLRELERETARAKSRNFGGDDPAIYVVRSTQDDDELMEIIENYEEKTMDYENVIKKLRAERESIKGLLSKIITVIDATEAA